MNVATWLARAGLTRPSLPALAFGDRVVADYATFARRSAGMATALRQASRLSRGDRVAIVASNHPSYLEALFGIWWAGLVAVPVNAKLHPSEIDWILGHAGARLAFVSPDREELVAAKLATEVSDVVSFESAAYAALTADEPSAVAPRGPDDLAWLFYTSGTTGRPKGAMLTHRNLQAMALAYLADFEPTRPGDTLLHAAPMSHGSGVWAVPHVCATALNAVPESAGFEPAEARNLIHLRPGTSLFAAPTMIRRLVAGEPTIDTGAVRTIAWGGAPMHVSDVIAALDCLGPCLGQVYGQGESPMSITFLPKCDVANRDHPRWRERIASAGYANSAVELRIGEPGDEARPSTGESGEVLVRGETVMAGYWQDPAATKTTLRNGWLHTGDVGHLTEDGYLTLLDRSTDLIISGGSNIYPREVEEVLADHPRVREVSVIGRADAEWGEIVVAYVAADAEPSELDQHCLERIARFKRPRDYVFLPTLPKNNYGKILKTELRAQDDQRRAAPAPGLAGTEN